MQLALQVEVRPQTIILPLRSEPPRGKATFRAVMGSSSRSLESTELRSASSLRANISTPAHFVLLLVLREQGKANSG